MNIIVTANLTPFIQGGADYHIKGLIDALRDHGHRVESVRLPFNAQSYSAIEDLMEYCRRLNFSQSNNISIDKVISLQFPGYGIQHHDHVVWIMHQHRAVYELYPSEPPPSLVLTHLRDAILQYDQAALSRANKLFANSKRVAERLKQHNQLKAEPLYHPPGMAEKFYCAPPMPYIFCPSRLEKLKRQNLLIEAAKYMRTPLVVLIAGEGPQRDEYARTIEKYQLKHKVRLLGRVSEAEKLSLYANSTAVFFAPYDEDYGYITLEAMLAEKPVLTTVDAGGPLEFVEHGKTGWVCQPEPKEIAEFLDSAYAHQARSLEMGKAGRARLEEQNIRWETVVQKLLGTH